MDPFLVRAEILLHSASKKSICSSRAFLKEEWCPYCLHYVFLVEELPSCSIKIDMCTPIENLKENFDVF